MMEAAQRIGIAVGSRRVGVDLGAAMAWAIPFVLIVYLALNNGGYDIVERSEVGIALWWIVLVGALLGTLSFLRGTALTAAFLLLAGFGAWTAISLAWTASDERTMVELGRVAALLAVFVLAGTTQSGRRWRAVLGGITAAAGLIVVLAALSRMHPDLFPDQTAAEAFPGVGLEARLAYPINYSTGVAVLAAMTLPLLLRASTEARLIAVRGLAAGIVPVAVLTLWLTGSSLSIPIVLVALGSYLLLAPDRLPKLLMILAGAAGGAILIAAAEQRSAVADGLTTPAALAEGNGLFAITVAVVVAVALIGVATGLGFRHGNRPGFLRVSRRRAALVCAAVAAVAAVAFALSPGPGKVEDVWHDFRGATKVDPASSSRAAQILDPSSRGRYRFWSAGIDAFESKPLLGIGPGTFEFWWARHGDEEFVRDAHSLYVEAFAELGLPGGLLMMGFVITVLVCSGVRALRAPPARRGGIAAATAAAAVFGFAAAVDWMWELGALAALFMALAATALAARDDAVEPDAGERGWTRWAVAILAAVGIAAVAIPLAGATAVTRSQEAAAAGDVAGALSDAEDGAAVQPYASTPELQQALLLEQQGRMEEAAVAARAATRNEPDNWRNWLTLSRIEAEVGNARGSVAAYRKARDLNPNSGLFAQ